MKKNITRMTAIICAGIMSVLLVACGSKFTTEDAQNYIKALGSIISTGTNDTGFEFDDLDESEYQSTHDTLVDTMVTSTNLDTYNVSDETKEDVREMYDNMLKSVSFDVGDATETDDGFEVAATIHPLDFTDMVDSEAILKDLQEKYTNGDITEDDLYDEYFKEYAKDMNEALKNDPKYGDDHEMTFVIQQDDDGNYVVSDDSATEFGENLFVTQ